MSRMVLRRATASLVAVACAATFVLPTVPAAAARPPPAKWDPRVLEYVKFVEKHRGLKFEHPIPIEFLDDEAFKQEVVTDDGDLTKADRQFGKEFSGDLFALGLAGPDFDYNAASNQLDAEGIVGFYDQDKKKMVVRGKDLTDTDVRVTIVHELTHVLQDQHFGINKLEGSTKSSGGDFAMTALIEGDATWVEEAYVATLPQAEQDAYYGSSNPSGEQPVVGAGADGSLVLDLLFSAPYELGYWFVDYVRSADSAGRGASARALDRVFRDPPPSDEDIIDPVAFVDDEQPHSPRVPKLQAGEKRRGSSDEIGTLTLAVILGSRLDPRTTLAAVTGWKGDTYVGFTRDDQPCIRDAIATDDVHEGTELAGALEAWAAKGPPGAASVERHGSDVVLTACGRADTTLPTEESLTNLFSALSSRYLNYEQFVTNTSLRPRDVRCLADLFSTDLELTELFNTVTADDVTPEQQALIDRRSREYADTCGLEATSS